MDATAVYVVFRNDELDLSWIPPQAKVIVVHNDRSLDPDSCPGPNVEHVFSDKNVGFAAGVNLALEHVNTDRVVLCNPDTVLHRDHWHALVGTSSNELVSLPIVQPDGTPTSVVNRYPTPGSLVLTGWRVGRMFRRGHWTRRVLVRALGRWGREHDALLAVRSGIWPLAAYWASGAVLSVDAARLRAVGGFDPAYFLYFEDIDLCHRLDLRFPRMSVRVAATRPAIHKVGGSGERRRPRVADVHYLTSARRWAAAQRGWAWRAADMALAPRMWLLGRAG